MYMIKCNNKILSSDFFIKYYEEINNDTKINEIYNYFLNYNNDKYKIGIDRCPKTKYKQELEFEQTKGYIQYIYKSIEFIIDRKMTSTELYNDSIEYCKKNYISTYNTREFYLYMNTNFLEFKKKSNGYYYYKIPDELTLRKHLYKLNKPYYCYVNEINEKDNDIFNDNIID